MELTHRFSVPASLPDTWAAFSRLEVIAPCYPGATISTVNGNEYVGSVKIKLGPFPLVYRGTARVLERDERSGRMRVEATGIDGRGTGEADIAVTATFHDRGVRTDVRTVTRLDITGRPAQLGGGVISDVSDRLLEQFLACISPKLEAGMEIPAPVSSAEAGPGTGGGWGAGGSSRLFTPSTNEAQPDFNVAATVVPALLKRFGAQLAAALAMVWVTVKLVRRWRR